MMNTILNNQQPRNKRPGTKTQAILTRMAMVVFLFLSHSSFASAPIHAPELVAHHDLQTPAGLRHYTLQVDLNGNGEKELLVIEDKITVLVARDTNKDGLFDAWFPLDRDGVVHGIDRESQDIDGWDVAQDIILKTPFAYSRTFMMAVMLRHAGDQVSFTLSNSDNMMALMTKQEIDLEDLNIRANRAEKINPRDKELLGTRIYLANSWEAVSNEAYDTETRKIFIGLAEDIGAYALTLGMAEGLGKALDWSMARFGETAVGEWTASVWTRFTEKLSERALQAAKLVRVPEVLAVEKLSGKALSESIENMLKGMESRNFVAKFAVGGIRFAGNVAKGAGNQWKYISLTQGLQLAAEVRDKDLFSADPIVLLKRMSSDKDLIQDFTYMTAETVLQTGIHASMPRGFAPFAVCAVVSFVDSNIMTLAVRNSTDSQRNALDTGYEMSIGNGQTMFDVKTMDVFNSAAARQNNKGLVLVGYAVTAVDQFGGYILYGNIAGEYDKDKIEHPNGNHLKHVFYKFFPIFAPK